MRLKSLNKNIEKFGFKEIIEYTDATFNGHQLGIAICIKDIQTGKVEQNLLSQTLGDNKTRDLLLSELFLDKSILLIENNIVQFNEEKEIVPKTIYYLPYYVEDHSVMKPTVNYENISPIDNTFYDIKVEVLFVEDNLNRYITIPFKTNDMSIMDLVNDLFVEYSNKEELEKIGIRWQKEGYILDFYNQAGERINLIFDDAARLKDAIVSVRLIDIACHYKEGDTDEKA